MQSKAVTVSSNFKRITVKAILSIVLFIVTYLLLITLALGITLLAAFVGIMLIAMKPMIITIMIGVGLVSMGGFVLIFMVKFISKKHTVDRSHLIEIKKEKEPELFAFINTIVESTPKSVHVYN